MNIKVEKKIELERDELAFILEKYLKETCLKQNESIIASSIYFEDDTTLVFDVACPTVSCDLTLKT